jgi:hypothetical protein
MSTRIKSVFATIALCTASTGAYALPVVCNPTQAAGSRVLTINTTAGVTAGSCFATGLTNLGDPGLLTLIGGGATLLDRDTTNANGGPLNIGGAGSQTNGTWSFTGSGTTSFLYFHFGNGNNAWSSTNPDYFVFQLTTPTGAASGTWTAGGSGADWMGLSNIAVAYRGTTTRVPEPTTLALLGLGLIGLTILRRLRAPA